MKYKSFEVYIYNICFSVSVRLEYIIIFLKLPFLNQPKDTSLLPDCIHRPISAVASGDFVELS